MRIAALHLIAYGHFGNKSLQFGKGPGFHLVYGDNEAGKSTALRALSSVLFGYPHGVVDGFKYDAKDIALGAELIASDGRSLSFIRKRRGQKALAAADGAVLDESALAAYLGGVSKDVFERVFALDHSRLHEYAQSLLTEGGSLGFSLAEAGSGVAGLKGVLDQLESERAALFLGSGSKPKLNQLISHLADLRVKARRVAVTLGDYKKRENEIHGIDEVLAEARARLADIDGQVRKLDRIGRNLPQKIQHGALSARLSELTEIPLLSDDISKRRIEAQTEHNAATADLETASSAITELEAEIASAAVDEETLARSAEFEALAELRPVVEAADKDLPKREAQRNQHYGAARILLVKAELTGDPMRLDAVLPSAVKRRSIAGLADKGGTLIGQEVEATNNLEAAREALRASAEKVKTIPASLDTTFLEIAWRAAQKLGAISQNIVKLRLTSERKTKVLDEAIVGLGIKTGGVSALRSLIVPSQKTIDHYKKLTGDQNVERETFQLECDRLAEEIEELNDRIADLAGGGDVVTSEEMQAKRQIRDKTWSIIRGNYIDKIAGKLDQLKEGVPEEGIADLFEGRMGDADRAADAIRDHVEEATELSLANRRKAILETKHEETSDKRNATHASYDALLSEWRDVWGPAPIAVRQPEEMEEWLKSRGRLLEDVEECEMLREEIKELEAHERMAFSALIKSLEDIGHRPQLDSLDALREFADKVIRDNAKTVAEFAKASQAVDTQKQNAARAEAARDKLSAQIRSWSGEWGAALMAAGLNSDLSIDAASVILGIMSELDGLKIQIDAVNHRIETMTSDRAIFARAVAPLTSLIPGTTGENAIETCRQLEFKLSEAKAAETNRKTLKGQLGIYEGTVKQAKEKLRRSDTELTALCTIAGCADATQLVSIEQKSDEKQRLSREREQIESRFRESGSGLGLEALFAECDGVIGDEIPGKLSALDEERAELVDSIEQKVALLAERNAELAGLFGQEQSADYLQNAAIDEAEIADNTRKYIELTLLEILLRQGIDIYRDRNQGPILMRAKTLFSQLTDGAYSGLRADVDDTGVPILIAEHSTRGSLDIPALSDGTVDPLYLALRLGVIQEHNATQEPLPFIADDLLLSLGNRRARATLKTLGTLAKECQVLFFTHHEHLVDLTRDVLDRNILHEHQL
jgi:uncharacterized protein YhaN